MSTAPPGRGHIELVVGASLYPEVVAKRQLLGFVLSLSTNGFVPPPPLVVRRDDRLEARTIRFEKPDQPLSTQIETGLPAGATLVRASPLSVQARTGLRGQPWPDPFQPARMVSMVLDTSKTSLESSFPGLVLGAAQVIVVQLRIWYRRLIAEYVDVLAAAQVLAALPAADAAALLRACPIDAAANLLKALLQDGVELLDFDRVAPLLADEQRVQWTDTGLVTVALPGRIGIAARRPADDAERRYVIARAVLVASTLWRRAGNNALQAWTLNQPNEGVPTADSTTEKAHFAKQLREQTAAAAEVQGAILICSPELRAKAANALRDTYPELMVVAQHELPGNIPVRPRGRIRIQPYDAASAERRSA